MLVYGTPIKALIHEKFGDGIMSMIDCKVSVDKKPDPKGDRVVLTFEYVSTYWSSGLQLTDISLTLAANSSLISPGD